LHKVRAIAWREFTSVVKTKAFFIGVILLPAIMLGSIFLQNVAKDTTDKTFAVIDRTKGQQVYPMFVSAVDDRNKNEVYDKSGKKVEGAFLLEKVQPEADVQKQRLELSNQVNAGRIFGFVEVGADVLHPGLTDMANASDDVTIRFAAKSAFLSDFKSLIQNQVIKRMYALRAPMLLIKEGQLKELLISPLVVNAGLVKVDSQSGHVHAEKAENEATSFILPFAAVMMMFVIILVGAAPMLQVVMEEKQQRIVEVLLGSVTPTQLMAGKLIGMVTTTGTLLLIYMTGAWWAVHRMGLQEYLSVNLMVWFVVLAVLAVTMLGSIYIAVGAAVQDLKEAQALLMPLNVIVMLPVLLIVNVLQNPSRPLAQVLTYWPTSAPMVAIARMAVRPGISTTETIGAVAATLVGTFVCVWAAGRIFRVGILMQGKRATLNLLARWIVAPERNATR
jgi:ABC-2 type transport system permease protein